MNEEPQKSQESRKTNLIVSNPSDISAMDFWRKLGSDIDTGIETFTKDFETEKSSVIAAALVQSFDTDEYAGLSLRKTGDTRFLIYKGSARPIFQRLCNLILSLLIISALSAVVMFKVRQQYKAGSERIVITRPEGLPAYYKINRNDTKTIGFSGNYAVQADSGFTGRYVLTSLPVNSTVSETNLLSQDLTSDMTDRQILSLPLKSESINSSIVPNRKINLIFTRSQDTSRSPVIVSGVILLGVEKQSNSVTLVIAPSAEQFNDVRDMLGRSDVYVTQN